MSLLKPILIPAILLSALLGSHALAIDPPPRVGAVRDAPKPVAPAVPADAAVLAQPKDAKAAPPQKPPAKAPKRRSVYQIIDPVPRVQSPIVYGPVLGPPTAVQPMPAPVPANPVILNGCNGGACLDASGAQYRGGVGSVLISPEGRACSNNGITVQCF